MTTEASSSGNIGVLRIKKVCYFFVYFPDLFYMKNLEHKCLMTYLIVFSILFSHFWTQMFDDLSNCFLNSFLTASVKLHFKFVPISFKTRPIRFGGDLGNWHLGKFGINCADPKIPAHVNNSEPIKLNYWLEWTERRCTGNRAPNSAWLCSASFLHTVPSLEVKIAAKTSPRLSFHNRSRAYKRRLRVQRFSILLTHYFAQNPTIADPRRGLLLQWVTAPAAVIPLLLAVSQQRPSSKSGQLSFCISKWPGASKVAGTGNTTTVYAFV